MIDAVSGLKNAVLVLIIVVAGHVLLPPPDPVRWRDAPPRGPPVFASGCPPGAPPRRCAPPRGRFGPGSCGYADHPSAPACDGRGLRGASLRVLPARGAGGHQGLSSAAAELASAEELYRFANEPPALRRPGGSPPAARADARPPVPHPGLSGRVEGSTEDLSCGYAAPF